MGTSMSLKTFCCRTSVLLFTGAVLLAVFTALVPLVLLHTYLAVTGQTTYEVMKGAPQRLFPCSNPLLFLW